MRDEDITKLVNALSYFDDTEREIHLRFIFKEAERKKNYNQQKNFRPNLILISGFTHMPGFTARDKEVFPISQ